MKQGKDTRALRVFDDAAIGDLVSGDKKIEDYDKIGSAQHAELLQRVLRSTSAPQVIAVFGDWGAGKTSIMQMLRERLDHDGDSCVTVWFNTWLHENDPSLLLSMAEELRKQLEGKPKFLQKAGKAAKSALSFLGGLLRTVSFSGGVGIPGLADANVTVDLSSLPESTDKDGTKVPLPTAVYEALSRLRLAAKQQIVVFLDDLDRCRPDRAMEILESLKLVFPHKGFAFVLGIANKNLETYVSYIHDKKFGIKDYDGRQYFEKLIQMSFQVPSLSNEQAETFVATLPGKVKGNQLEPVASVIRIAGRNNPRAMKRFANGLLVDSYMSTRDSTTTTHKVSTGDLAVARALRENWLQEYSVLLGSKKDCNATAAWLKNRTKTNPAIYASISGDPDLEEVLKSKPGMHWLRNWAHHMEIERWVRPQVAQRTDTKRYDVYISYRWMDRGTAEEIADFLKGQGLSVMWDGRLQVGMNWRKVLESGLRQSRAMLFLVSDLQTAKDPVVSDSQMSEANLAVELADAESDFLLIPVLLYRDSERWCPPALRDFFWVQPPNGIDTKKLDQQLGEVVALLQKSKLTDLG
jgi:hypothetical protein